jgi:hypothetical protein
MKLRRPYVGDVLLEPQRFVCWVDGSRRVFRCQPLEGTPERHYGRENLPHEMQGKPFEAAPLEEGWTELPILTIP